VVLKSYEKKKIFFFKKRDTWSSNNQQKHDIKNFHVACVARKNYISIYIDIALKAEKFYVVIQVIGIVARDQQRRCDISVSQDSYSTLLAHRRLPILTDLPYLWNQGWASWHDHVPSFSLCYLFRILTWRQWLALQVIDWPELLHKTITCNYFLAQTWRFLLGIGVGVISFLPVLVLWRYSPCQAGRGASFCVARDCPLWSQLSLVIILNWCGNKSSW